MKDIVEIRWHGRGGQGAKTASLLLADAAFNTGKYVQGFPEYGPERMGAPITAYNRISSERSTVHSNIYYPDYVVVVDETLLSAVDVTAGLKKEGAIVINSSKSPAELRPLLKGYEGRVCTIDAGKISEEELRAAYEKYYQKEYFVRLLKPGVVPQTRWVEGSNFADVNFKLDPRTNRVVMMGAIDNMVKGAAGQAIQNMNLMFGLAEHTGLRQVPMFP